MKRTGRRDVYPPSGHEILRQSAVDGDKKFWTGKLHVSILQWIGLTVLWVAGILIFVASFDVGSSTQTVLQRIATASLQWIIAIGVVGGTVAFIRWSLRRNE